MDDPRYLLNNKHDFRFSLRTLLILTLLIGVISIFLAPSIRRMNHSDVRFVLMLIICIGLGMAGGWIVYLVIRSLSVRQSGTLLFRMLRGKLDCWSYLKVFTLSLPVGVLIAYGMLLLALSLGLESVFEQYINPLNMVFGGIGMAFGILFTMTSKFGSVNSLEIYDRGYVLYGIAFTPWKLVKEFRITSQDPLTLVFINRHPANAWIHTPGPETITIFEAYGVDADYVEEVLAKYSNYVPVSAVPSAD